jgi:hypothetical protein
MRCIFLSAETRRPLDHSVHCRPTRSLDERPRSGRSCLPAVTTHTLKWTFSHDGGRVYPTHTRNHPAWRGTHRARRPRAHGSAEASPAQHHCTLRARSLTHSSLDAVQSGVANANHHCNSTANICTTTPSMHTRGGTCRANASTLPASHRAIHCRRPGLAALLLALLHAHLIALHLL